MTVIDIEARAAAREARPMIQFYRTATDKPGKPWRQPNDGPAPDRYERAAEAMAKITRKAKPSVIPIQPMTLRAMRALAAGEMHNDVLAELLEIGPTALRDRLQKVKAHGFVASPRRAYWSLTAEGHARLEEEA
jgi:hypothetical protein